MTTNKRLPGNPYHDRAENIRLMHAALDNLNEQEPVGRTTTELLLFEISDRLAALAYEQRTANEIAYATASTATDGRPISHPMILEHLVAVSQRLRDRGSDDD